MTQTNVIVWLLFITLFLGGFTTTLTAVVAWILLFALNMLHSIETSMENDDE